MRAFLDFWRKYSSLDPERMFDGWLREYMARYPELLIKQVGSWGGLDELRDVMLRKVIPMIDELIHEIFEAWMITLEVAEDVCSRAADLFKLDLDPIIVIYVGSGCGAGWATTISNHPAVLLGLENAAELGWITEEKLKGLIAHELGHLHHMKLRRGWIEIEEAEKDPYFQLYVEGFAQLCEHLILGHDSWHVAIGEDWLRICKGRIGDFAEEYLRAAERGDVRAFFGPWLEVKGVKHVGHFLGHELMAWLRKDLGLSFREIALLSRADVESLSKRFLEEVAGKK